MDFGNGTIERAVQVIICNISDKFINSRQNQLTCCVIQNYAKPLESYILCKTKKMEIIFGGLFSRYFAGSVEIGLVGNK